MVSVSTITYLVCGPFLKKCVINQDYFYCSGITGKETCRGVYHSSEKEWEIQKNFKVVLRISLEDLPTRFFRVMRPSGKGVPASMPHPNNKYTQSKILLVGHFRKLSASSGNFSNFLFGVPPHFTSKSWHLQFPKGVSLMYETY